MLLLPGNHDDPEQLRQVFAHHPYWQSGPFAHYAVQVAGVKIIALDTTVPGHSHGRLCAHRLQWLAEQLQRSAEQDVVVAMHHPPFRTGITYMDEMGLLEGSEALHALLRQHPSVQRVLCGHVHRSVQALWGGTLAMCAPSVAHQVVLDLRPGAPGQWAMEPAAGLVHAWGPECGWLSHSLAIGHGAESFDF